MINKKVLSLSLLAGSLALSSAAFASADHGMYVGGALGYSASDYTASNQGVNSGIPHTFSFDGGDGITKNIAGSKKADEDNTGLGGRIFAGYQINKYFGVEGGYTQYV